MEMNNIYYAKTHLSALIEQVLHGEEVIIAKAGKPVAVLSPYTGSKQKLEFGSMKGKVIMTPDFDELPESFMKYFR